MSDLLCVEVVDSTCDEVYYPVGTWSTLVEAVTAVVGFYHENKEPPIADGNDDYERVILTFRELRRGFGDPKEIMQIEFIEEFIDERDQTEWHWKLMPFQGKDEHPDNYGSDCGCDTCLSYGEPE